MADAEISSLVPESVTDSAKSNLANLQQLETHLLHFLSLADSDTMAELTPIDRAQSLFMLAKATTLLFALRLKCNGIDPDEHPVKTELERLSLYQDKLERSIDLSKAPLRPSTTLNSRAAARVIEHALPDLTPDQRKSMREISKEEGPKMKYLESRIQKKRKYQSSERHSVQAAASDFLEKASRELLGDNKHGFKGPLRMDSNDLSD
ncbi:Nuclear nucleic acid-binding protein C1D [Euphorbia peplus]|nr:Nuclear nucleic acid-binding protein C1D [Euphorbia peplus]